jgi:hypothetical protein
LINSIVSVGGRVYAAGYFEQMGGVDVNNIAMWDGLSWSPLGSGVENQIRAMAANNDGLYVAGDFVTAGGKLSHHFGRWTRPLSGTVASSPVVAGEGEKGATGRHGAYPNPISSSTTISFFTPASGHVELRIHDLLGREVDVLVDEDFGSGHHESYWNAAGVPDGLYSYRLLIGNEILTGTMMVAH